MRRLHDFYLVNPGGKMDSMIADFVADRRRAMDLRKAVCEKYKADEVFANSAKIVGLKFKDKIPPKGFKAMPEDLRLIPDCEEYDYIFIPDRKTTEGQLIALDFVIPLKNENDFHLFLDGTSNGTIVGRTPGGDDMVERMHFEYFREQVVLVIPRDLNGTPGYIKAFEQDCTLLKHSEFWSMVETKDNAL